MGYDPDDKDGSRQCEERGPKSYGIAFAGQPLPAFMLGKIIFKSGHLDRILYGMKVGFAVWLAFVMTVQLTEVLFGNRPRNLFLINTGYQMACYLVMGAILGKWVGC